MLAPDSNDIFDKLRHAVAVSGSGLPIHKGDDAPEPEEPAPPPIPYEDDGVFDVSSLRTSLSAAIREQDEARAQREAEEKHAQEQQEQQEPEPSAAVPDPVGDLPMASPAMEILHHPVLNPVLPREFENHDWDMEVQERRIGARALLVLLAGVALLIGGGAVVAHKTGWMSMSAVHIKSGQGKAADGSAPGSGKGIRKVMTPPPPGGPSLDDIQDAANTAVSSHYASMGVAADLKASLNSLRVIARQPTDNPGNWQVLMTVTVRVLPKGTQARAAERKEGYPEKGQSSVLELPKNAGDDGAPPPAPFISAPLPAQKQEAGTLSTPPAKSNGREAPPPPATEPQPRWVDVNWSGERWFIGDYEFD